MGFGICKANNTNKIIIIKEDFSNQPDIKESSEPMTINEIKNFKHIEPMSKKEIKDLYSNQPSMCKINFQKEKDGQIFDSSGTGFFCEINDDNIPFKKALFTNNHVLNESYMKKKLFIVTISIKSEFFC